MAESHGDDSIKGLVIRSYAATDQASVSHLYTHGMLAGQMAPNDTGADIENVEHAYQSDPRNHFWVAEAAGQVLGMIGVAADREHTAEIRRLRVEKDFQTTAIAGRLVETALAHCKQHGYVKVVLDTRFERDAAFDLFDRFGFQHARTKPVHGKELLEFYLDLYRQTKPEGEGSV